LDSRDIHVGAEAAKASNDHTSTWYKNLQCMGITNISTYALTHGVELNQVQRIFDLNFTVYLLSYTYVNDK
jgi:hypothetical protein